MSASRTRLVLRVRPRFSRRTRFFVASALIHAAFVAALVLLPGLRSRSAGPDEFLVVDLVGGLSPGAAARGEPARQEPPESEPVAPEPEGVRIETKEPEPETAKDKPSEKTPEPEKKVDPEPQRQPHSRPSAPAGAPPAGGGSGTGSITSLDLSDLEHAWYRDTVVVALQSHWIRPILEGTRQTLEVTVAFEIQRDGDVRDLRIDSPSGVPSLDRSALRAVADAAPLPPVPPSWREPSIPARFVFRLHPDQD